MQVITFLLSALAAFRLTRLLQRDSFPPAAALRSLVVERGPGWLVEMYECGWCLGMYVAFAVVAVSRLAPQQWELVAMALAISTVIGFLSERDAD